MDPGIERWQGPPSRCSTRLTLSGLLMSSVQHRSATTQVPMWVAPCIDLFVIAINNDEDEFYRRSFCFLVRPISLVP